ncbi:GntP family permease [Actinoallomurus acanthiterrae]
MTVVTLSQIVIVRDGPRGHPPVTHRARPVTPAGHPGRSPRPVTLAGPRERLSSVVENSLAPIAGVLLIVSAGGGFKQTLIDIGVGQMIVDFSKYWSIPALVLGWLIAVAIRLATGSATVATVSAAGLVAPLTAGMSTSHVALLVLAVGAGSLFFSHVNDAGFWLVKEYFGLTVGQTVKTWSVMETIISVVAFGLILALSLIL